MVKKFLAITLSILLVGSVPAPAAPAEETDTLRELVERSYLSLLELAPALNFSRKEIETTRKRLETEKKAEQTRLEQEEKQLKKQGEEARKRLAELNKSARRETPEVVEQRRALHCQIVRVETQITELQFQRKHGVAVAYSNKLAKLDLIEKWPSKKKEIEKARKTGQARNRRYGDVLDIGIRKVGEGQEKDIKRGQEAIRQLKAYGLLPPEIEDEAINEYLRRLTRRLAAQSDLRIPIQVTLLDSKEINAFALPGGFLYVNRGFFERAETESELAGVIAHEIAHAAARHSARLMKKATIAGIIFQAAQIAALIYTGGLVSIGTYYALQYGFFGLGMLLQLSLLGVSREYEDEADQLGVQYLWNAGYDSTGFINFFDKMASEKGYVRSASFFRTHPPFFDRIVSSFSEIAYLPEKEDMIVDTRQFHEMKTRLAALETQKAREAEAPTLKRFPSCPDASETPVQEEVLVPEEEPSRPSDEGRE